MISNEPSAFPRPTPALRLPMARPWVTYLLLALIGVAFGAESVLGGSTNIFTLRMLGAQVNPLIARGEYWRLFSTLFLHIGLMHVAFNGWALFSLGREVEAFYGSGRFALLYFLSGLGGGVAYYLLGSSALSAGASGAVFGLVGAEIAYFLRNRELFGAFGRQRLGNLATLVGVNLLFGFTVPGINNLAHMGGLLTGLALGFGLCPHYGVVWEWVGFYPAPRLVNWAPLWRQMLAVVAAVVFIWAGLWLGDQRW
jgi:rhomboid protease GluP